MRPTSYFLTLVSPVVFFSHGAAARGMSPHEYYKHVKVLENWGTSKALNDSTPVPSNATTIGGQICYMDIYYQAFHAFLPDVIPFCRSWLPIPDITITSANTVLSTLTTIVTQTLAQENTATIPDTVTATATSTSYFGVPAATPAVTLAPRADARHIKALKEQAICTDTSIISGISSACLCLGLVPTTTAVYTNTTRTVTLSGILWERNSKVITKTNGVVTVTQTVPLYLPSTVVVTTSALVVNSTTVTIPATLTTTLTNTLGNTSVVTVPATTLTNTLTNTSVVAVPTSTRILTTLTTTNIFGQPTTVTEIIENNRTITLHESTTTTTTVYETIYPGLSSTVDTSTLGGNITTTTLLDPNITVITETSRTTIPITETLRTTISRTTPSISAGTGSRTISIVTTTGASGQPTTVTLEIGNNYTSTLYSNTTTTETLRFTILPPSWSGNYSTIPSTGTAPSSGFPVPSVPPVLNSSIVPSSSISIPTSTPSGLPIPYPNSTTLFSTAPGTAPLTSITPITTLNTTSSAIITVPTTITIPESASYSYSTAPNSSVTSYPYYDSIESGIIVIPWTSNVTSVQTLTSVSVGATTSYWTSTHPRVWPNGTGGPSYSIIRSTATETTKVTVPLLTGTAPILQLPSTTVPLETGLQTQAPGFGGVVGSDEGSPAPETFNIVGETQNAPEVEEAAPEVEGEEAEGNMEDMVMADEAAPSPEEAVPEPEQANIEAEEAEEVANEPVPETEAEAVDAAEITDEVAPEAQAEPEAEAEAVDTAEVANEAAPEAQAEAQAVDTAEIADEAVPEPAVEAEAVDTAEEIQKRAPRLRVRHGAPWV